MGKREAGMSERALTAREKTAPHPFGRKVMAAQLLDGSVVICDPDAPIEHGCRVLLVIPGYQGSTGAAIEGRCLTKHPSKTKGPLCAGLA
jgi:hypothetical protein